MLDEGLAPRPPRRRRSIEPAEPVNDRTHWTVTGGGTVTYVASRAAAWSVATAAYTRGHPVVVRSTE
ncbi:MAG: hypothetical protein QOH72_4650 [Solirubrobacteraceae bacterium]|jgi:hypothetical protein|nr:hypothetical protein [Solirubrobacteraceae bacterium]